MGKHAILFIALGCFMPLFILTGLYILPSSPIYNDADWLWITRMYALFCGLITILGVAFYGLGRR